MIFSSPDNERCPVQSFIKYITHLHPMTDCFWQRPKKNVQATDYIWYENTVLGNSTLSKMMQKISRDSDVKHVYTNHAIHSSHIPVIGNIRPELNPQWTFKEETISLNPDVSVSARANNKLPIKLEKEEEESPENSNSEIGMAIY